MKRRARLSVTLQRYFRWVFPSPFSSVSFTVNCTTENEGTQWEKAALNPFVSSWSVSFEFSSLWRKDQIYTYHCGKQTSKFSQLQNGLKNLNLLTITLLAIYLLNNGKSSTLINRRWDLIIISVRSLTVFEGKIFATALTKLVPLFFSKLYLRFSWLILL